jgi:hypothetical protein
MGLDVISTPEDAPLDACSAVVSLSLVMGLDVISTPEDAPSAVTVELVSCEG